jgi:hypothetical protein
MKVVVFSDVHGVKMVVDKIVELNPDADYILSLGDSELQEDYLRTHDIICVRGNYPRDPGFLYDSNITIEGKKIFFTHGHKYKVGRSIVKLVKLAINKEYDIVLYGHTHIAALDVENGITFANPGSCAKSRTLLPPTYLIITIEKGATTFTFKDSFTNQTIEI